VGCLIAPTLVYPGAWGNTFPEWLEDAITLERLGICERVPAFLLGLHKMDDCYLIGRTSATLIQSNQIELVDKAQEFTSA